MSLYTTRISLKSGIKIVIRSIFSIILILLLLDVCFAADPTKSEKEIFGLQKELSIIKSNLAIFEKNFQGLNQSIGSFDERLNVLQSRMEKLDIELKDQIKTATVEAKEAIRNFTIDSQELNQSIGSFDERLNVLQSRMEKLDNDSTKQSFFDKYGWIINIYVLTGIGLLLFWQFRGLKKKSENEISEIVSERSEKLEEIYSKKARSFIGKLRAQQDTIAKQISESEKNLSTFFDFMNLFPRKNPYVVGAPIDDRNLFVGRSEIIRKVLHGIHNNHFYILGQRRSGKTSLLRKIKEELVNISEPNIIYQPILIDLQSLSEKTFFNSLCLELLRSANDLLRKLELKGISETLNANFKSFAESGESDDDFVDLFDEIYNKIASDKNIRIIFVLMIDEFDKINGFQLECKENFRSIFMRKDKQLRLIATGGELEEWDSSSPFNFMITLEIDKLTKKQALQLIVNPAKGVVVLEKEVIDYILTASKLKPFEIQKICSLLVDYAIDEMIFKINKDVLKEFLSSQKTDQGN